MASTSLSVTNSVQQNTTVVPDSDQTDVWKATSPRITFLSFFILFGMVGNACVIITICHSRRFRTTAFYVFIINLSVINMCECLLNMTVLMSTSVTNDWYHGETPCKLNAFFVNLICIETLLGLTIITTDRMIAIKYRDKYDHVISSARFSLLITFSWVQSFAFSLPIGIGSVPSTVYEYIHYCTIGTGVSTIYCAVMTILCYIGPLILCVCFFVFIVRTWYKERFAVRALLARSNYDESVTEEPRIRREIQYSNLSATVCLSWLILECPYVATLTYKLFQTSSELGGNNNDTLQYSWHVDLVLLLLKFSYVLVLPIAAFVWSKELRKELKDIVLCRKNNAVIDASIEKSRVEVQRLKNVREEEKIKESLSQQKEPRVFQIPVLFATSHGVHIKTIVKTNTDESEKINDAEFLERKCDVAGSRDNLNVLGDDTSDYDSGNELDPFSVSHPVSVRQLHDNHLTSKHRSNSQPEVRDRSDKVKTCNTTVGSTSAGDSGLDLSTGYNSVSRISYSDVEKHQISTGSEVIVESSNMEILKTNNEENINKVKSDKRENAKIYNKPYTKETIVSRIGDVVNDVTEPDNLQITDPTLQREAENLSDSKFTQTKTSQECSNNPDTNVPRRKKKKRREKMTEDSKSVTSDPTVSSPKLPLRPPARLAPINADLTAIKTRYSDFPRPESSCSNHSSIMDINTECVRSESSIRDSETKDDSKSLKHACVDSGSLPNFSTTSSSNLNNTCDRTVSVPMSLDCNRTLQVLTEEVLTPSDCHMTETLHVTSVNANSPTVASPSGPLGDATVGEFAVNDAVATYAGDGTDNPGFTLRSDDDSSKSRQNNSPINTSTDDSNDQDDEDKQQLLSDN